MVKNLPAMQEAQERRVRSLGQKDSRSRKWQPTPVLLARKFHVQRSMVGYSLWGCKESDIPEHPRMSVYIYIYIHVNQHYCFSMNQFPSIQIYRLMTSTVASTSWIVCQLLYFLCIDFFYLYDFYESYHAYPRSQIQGWAYDSNCVNFYISKEYAIIFKRENQLPFFWWLDQ